MAITNIWENLFRKEEEDAVSLTDTAMNLQQSFRKPDPMLVFKIRTSDKS